MDILTTQEVIEDIMKDESYALRMVLINRLNAFISESRYRAVYEHYEEVYSERTQPITVQITADYKDRLQEAWRQICQMWEIDPHEHCEDERALKLSQERLDRMTEARNQALDRAAAEINAVNARNTEAKKRVESTAGELLHDIDLMCQNDATHAERRGQLKLYMAKLRDLIRDIGSMPFDDIPI